MPLHSTLIDGIQTPSTPVAKNVKPGTVDQPQDNSPSSGLAQEQGNVKEYEDGCDPQDGSPSLGSVPHMNKNGVVVTDIQVTNPALGLQRIPAGFYAVVHHSGLQWRTNHKHSSVGSDVVEWTGPIPLPSDLSATVCFEVYAPFEYQPTLGTGEHLYWLTITTEQLLDHSAKRIPSTLFSKDVDIVPPCSSILVTIKRCKGVSSESLVSQVNSPLCLTTESRDELEYATDQGHSALLLYKRHGDKRDLERSAAEFERVLDICPLNHPCRAVVQSNLAMAKFILCLVDEMGAPFEIPLGLYCDALTARPVGHADRPATLIRLAAVHLARFEKQGIEADGAQVESLLHEAMELSSTDSYENRAVAFMLQLYSGHGVGSGHTSGPLSPPASADSRSGPRLMDENPGILSVQLIERFERHGDLADLEQAVQLLRESIRSAPVWDDRCSASLGNFGLTLLCRYKRQGELSVLLHTISILTEAVDLTVDGHSNKPRDLNHLGLALRARFERLGELNDLEDAISAHKNAADLTPNGHPDRPSYLNNLGLSLITRFRRLGELSDLEDAISTLRDALVHTPDGNPDRLYYLNNLGLFLLSRFEHLGKLSDLEDAISTHKDVVFLTPDGHPGKPSCLNNLSLCFRARFERIGKLSDLEDAISVLRDAAVLLPDGHLVSPKHLNNLGLCLGDRFKHFGELSDLEDAISTFRDAVVHTPDGHPDKPGYLNNLGTSFLARFEHLGRLSDLEDALSSQRDAVVFTPNGHPDKPKHLNNLGLSLRIRFEHFGELNDLEDAVSTHRDAVVLIPDGHPDKSSCLNNLGLCFRARFERLGKLSELEDAISAHREAVILTPDGHPVNPSHLNNLGLSFKARFEQFGELSDLEDAISTLKDAVVLAPNRHHARQHYLNNLGISFRARFQHLGELSDLQDTISTLMEAVVLTPDGHPKKPSRLNNLGNSYFTRFERLGELDDLENAISTQRYAIALTPNGHPDKPTCLHNLGNSLATRFERLGELNDLEDAVSTCREAIILTPDGHPNKLSLLNDLASSFVTRFEHLGERKDLDDAMTLYSWSASLSIGPISTQFRASQNWVSCAQRMHHPSLLRAYSMSINLLPRLAWIGLPLAHRYAELKQGVDVVREAATTALNSGSPELAVEWLEQGRSIVWGELLQLRSSFEQLWSAHPDHAYRLQELSMALENAGATREKLLSTPLEQTDNVVDRLSLQHEADTQRRLAINRDNLLQEIRRFPGFERFLLRKDFSQLRASAISGPVVLLNAAKDRCDAMAVLAGVDHVLHVPLPEFNFQRCTQLQQSLGNLLGNLRGTPPDERKAVLAIRNRIDWESLLSTLWNGIVKPVLDALAFPPTPEELARIFWCPTGPFTFFPIHAAGLYGAQHSSPGHKVFDFVVSSYVPTLSTLTRSLGLSMQPSGDLHLLFVPQPSSDGENHLPGVHAELEHIKEVIGSSPSPSAILFKSSVSTVEEVLGLMKDAEWVHFACHGIQDAAKPTESGLCLADRRRLKISDIIGLSRSRGGLAFLSACHTATGDKGLSDEAIHIAAGMLFAGYGGVIGTMWSISDGHAPVVARDVYRHLLHNGTRPDYRDAARALHEAIRRLRESGEASFVTWLPFIHVGL